MVDKFKSPKKMDIQSKTEEQWSYKSATQIQSSYKSKKEEDMDIQDKTEEQLSYKMEIQPDSITIKKSDTPTVKQSDTPTVKQSDSPIQKQRSNEMEEEDDSKISEFNTGEEEEKKDDIAPIEKVLVDSEQLKDIDKFINDLNDEKQTINTIQAKDIKKYLVDKYKKFMIPKDNKDGIVYEHFPESVKIGLKKKLNTMLDIDDYFYPDGRKKDPMNPNDIHFSIFLLDLFTLSKDENIFKIDEKDKNHIKVQNLFNSEELLKKAYKFLKKAYVNVQIQMDKNIRTEETNYDYIFNQINKINKYINDKNKKKFKYYILPMFDDNIIKTQNDFVNYIMKNKK